MQKIVSILAGVILFGNTLVVAQDILPENLGTDAYSVQYRAAFGILNQFRNANPVVQAYENKLNPLERLLESIKTQLRNFIASLGSETPPSPATPPLVPEPPTPPTTCANQLPILNGAEDRTIIANNSQFPLEYDGTFKDFQHTINTPDWPGITSDTVSLSLTSNKYIAAKFTTNNLSQTYRFQFGGPGNIEGGPTNGQVVTISECPGDFTTHLNQSTCKISSSRMRWSTDLNADPNIYCKLQKTHTYYFNIVHSNNSENDNYSTTDCPFNHCGVLGSQSPESISNITNTTPTVCSTQLPILDGNEDIHPEDYSDVAAGNNTHIFPGVEGSAMSFGIDSGKYVALEFNSGLIPYLGARHGLVTPSNAQGGIPNGGTSYSISECPGDFSTHLNQRGCLKVGGLQQMRWSVGQPIAPDSSFCNLELNKTYYMNFVHAANSPNYDISTCSDPDCGVLMTTVTIISK
jgi:hypothetical protein